MLTEIKRLPDGVKDFTANGRRYIVHEKLTFDAFQQLEDLRFELQAGTSVGDILKGQAKAIGALNKADFYTAAVILYNCQSAAERIAEKIPHPLLLILTLFVRPEGSDLSRWEQAEALTWINDFNEEGIATDDLFRLAGYCIISSDSDLALNSQSISLPGSEESQ